MRRYLCEPMVIYTNLVYEAEGDHSTDAVYNCHECFNTDCGYWEHYNHCDDEEITEQDIERLRQLNPDIAEFFEATCERYRKND